MTPAPVIHFAETGAIQVPEYRQRSKMGEEELSALRTSLERNGLMHPLVVRREGSVLWLVAGERRLTAIRDLWGLGGTLRCGTLDVPYGHAPFLLLGELNPLQAMEAEYEENVRRVDLSWQEKAKATADLAALRQAQATKAGETPPAVADLAEEVRGSRGSNAILATRQELVAAARLSDPDVAKAKSLTEASKIIERKEQKRKNEVMAGLLGPQVVASRHQLVKGDCRAWMAGAADGQFDVILTDPPYGMGADEFGDSGGKTDVAHGYVDDSAHFLRLMRNFAEDCFRLTKPEAWAFIFCDLEQFHFLRGEWGEAGWRVFRTPLVWHKPQGMRAPWPERGPQRAYELCLFAAKGEWDKIKVQTMGKDVVTAGADENLGHAAQKPMGLFVELLRRVCRPGMRVFDPFCGTGTVFEAAQQVKVFVTGVELDEAHYSIAASRLQKLKDEE